MTLFKNGTADCTKRRLMLLFLLNVSDWICTLSLLSTGHFAEANPLMQGVVNSLPLGFAVKVLLPLGLIVLAVKKLKYTDEKQLVTANNIVLFGVVVYTLLNLYHLYCFTVLFSYFI